MPEVSIMVSARDSFSPSVKSMTSSLKGFSKEAEEAAEEIQTLEKKQEELCDRQAKLRVSVDDMKSSLSAARKEFKLTGDEASRMTLENAYKGISKLSDELSSCKREMRETDKAMQELNSTQSKSSNRASGDKSMFATLASAGFTKMAGDVIAQGSNYYVGSAFGSDVGGMFGSTLSGAATGAAMGSITPLGPGVGTLVGGVAGGAMGLMSGGINIAQRQDDAFKGVVQSEYDRLLHANVAMVESGVNVSARREIDQNAFSKMLGGDMMVTQFLDWVKDAAAATPMCYDDLTQMSRRLKTFGYDTEQVKDMLLTIGDTGAGTGSDTYGMQMMINGLGRIKQSGKTNLEYMNPMIESGVPVWEYLQAGLENELGKSLTIQEVQKMSSQNEIDADKAVSYIMTGMKDDFGGLMAEQAKTFNGLTSTLEDMRSNIEAAAGEGFNTMRKPAMQEQVEHYDIMGNKYEEAAEISGKLMAVQKNQQERIFRDTLTTLFDSDEYTTALEIVERAESYLDEARKIGDQDAIIAGENALAAALAKAQTLVDEAEGQAQVLFKESNVEKTIQDANTDLLGGLRGFLKEDDAWKMWGYNIGMEMGKGMMSVTPENIPTDPSNYLPNRVVVDNGLTSTELSYSDFGLDPTKGYPLPSRMPGYAFGLNHVPYNNFPAMLHQGERVLTASQARSADSGRSIAPVTITGNQFTVREEADIDRIAAELARQLEKASMIYAN